MTTPEAASKVLRKGFPADEVGKLPKISCTQCTKSPNKVCDRHGGKKAKCRECGAFITTAHVHLDYVGHAGVTNRLLDADPTWTWEPVAWDAEGAPLVQHGKNESVMWVRLTVGGVTRYGVGSAPLGSFELHKQLVSDAIRNASMRFGVALALWAKEPLPEAIEQDAPLESPGGGDAGRPSTADVASPGVPAPDREAPTAPPVVEPVVSHGDEVGTAPPGGSPLPGGNDVTGGGEALRDEAPSGGNDAPTPLKAINERAYQSLNRKCRAIHANHADDDKDTAKAQWEALAWACSGGRTVHLGELSPDEASVFRTRMVDLSEGRSTWAETNDPAWLGWTLEATA